MIRKCVICQTEFKCSPSDKKITCSRECKGKRTAITHRGKKYPWSEEAKKRLSEKGETPNLKLGTPAAQKSPKAGRFETNCNAKFWRIISPDGEIFEINNLRHWARKNQWRFGKDNTEKAANQISGGFKTCKRNMVKGKGTVTYMGWSILYYQDEPLN